MIEWVKWFFINLFQAFGHIWTTATRPDLWLFWGNAEPNPETNVALGNEAMMRFIYYGGSVEFFYSVILIFLILTGIGLWQNRFMWGMVRTLEGFSNWLGRGAAWAGLFMVVQQVLIVFLQRIFRVSEISISPFGLDFTRDLSWYGEELKLYNAAIVALCVSYTFIQGGHVRVDLIYSSVRFRTKRVIDMFGALFFMLPMATLTWMYAWYFMWRHLVTPKVSASDTLELLMRKARVLKWNVETIGFSPNGFDGYFLFKILLVAFTGLVFLQGISMFYRSFLEWKEGEESENKYLVKDSLGEGQEAYEGTH